MEERQGPDPENAPLSASPQPKNRSWMPFSWWWIVSALAMGLIFGIGGLELIRLLARPIALLILAVSIASALAPVVDWLSIRLPRSLAVILVYFILVLIIVGVLSATVPLLGAQVRELFREMRVWLPMAADWLAQFGFDPQGLRGTLLSEAGQLGMLFIRLPIALGRTIFELVLVLFMSLYWMFLIPSIKQFFLSFFPADRKGSVTPVLTHMGTEMGGYLRGAAINGIILGVAKYVGLLIIGVPYALTLGALAALMEFFPTIGPTISGTIATLVALSVSPRLAVITAMYAIILQQTEGHILVPLIMRSQTEISPLLAIFSIVAGAAIGGLLGAVIAIPTASVITVLVRRVIAPALRRANGVGAEEV